MKLERCGMLCSPQGESEKLGKSNGNESEREKEKQCFGRKQTRKWRLEEKTSRKTIFEAE